MQNSENWRFVVRGTAGNYNLTSWQFSTVSKLFSFPPQPLKVKVSHFDVAEL